jgi:hypothetical protein
MFTLCDMNDMDCTDCVMLVPWIETDTVSLLCSALMLYFILLAAGWSDGGQEPHVFGRNTYRDADDKHSSGSTPAVDPPSFSWHLISKSKSLTKFCSLLLLVVLIVISWILCLISLNSFSRSCITVKVLIYTWGRNYANYMNKWWNFRTHIVIRIWCNVYYIQLPCIVFLRG